MAGRWAARARRLPRGELTDQLLHDRSKKNQSDPFAPLLLTPCRRASAPLAASRTRACASTTGRRRRCGGGRRARAACATCATSRAAQRTASASRPLPRRRARKAAVPVAPAAPAAPQRRRRARGARDYCFREPLRLQFPWRGSARTPFFNLLDRGGRAARGVAWGGRGGVLGPRRTEGPWGSEGCAIDDFKVRLT